MRIIGNDPNKPRQTAAVASGTLPNGKPVVVNADGTVSIVSTSGTAGQVGSQAIFETGATEHGGSTYDSINNKVVFVYKDDDNLDYGTVVVGDVSGTSITFGTPVVYSSINTDWSNATFDSNAGKVVISYYKNNVDDSYSVVGTVSGTSISLGTEVQWSSVAGVAYIQSTFDTTNNKVVIAFKDGPNGGKAIVGTVSGTSISFGTAAAFNAAATTYVGVGFDSTNNKIVVGFIDASDADKLKAAVGTVSGTSISFGTKVALPSNAASSNGWIPVVHDPSSGKTVIIGRNNQNTNKADAVVGTVSGTSISFGSLVTIGDEAIAGDRNGPRATYDSGTGKIAVIIRVNSGPLNLYMGTVSGNTISFGDPQEVSAATVSETYGIVYDDNAQKLVAGYSYSGGSAVRDGASNVIQPDTLTTNLTAENYIGMSGGVLEDTNQSEAVGTPSVYATTDALQSDLAYDSTSGKMVLAWRDSNSGNGHGKAVVITVSGTTLSYGTPVTFNAASTRIPKVVFDSANNKIVIAYRDDGNNNYSTAIVGTVSGTSISFGTPVVWKSANNSGIGATYDPDNSKVIVGSAGTGAGAYEVFVGTVSGTSISFGSSSGSLGTAYSGELAYDETNNKVIAALHIYPSTGSTFVGTVSGTSISFGSANNITTSGFSDIWGLVYDSNSSNMVMCYQANGLYAIVGEVSGTSMTFGSSVVVQASSNEADIGYDSLINKPIVAFKDVGNSNNGTLKVGTVSGTSISFGSATVYETGDATQNAIGFDSGEGKSVISFSDGDNNSYGTAVAYQAAGSYQSRGEVADGGNAVVDVQGGISDIQENLTAGQSYYVQTNGTISTTAGDPSVFAGTAVSSTKLIVKG